MRGERWYVHNSLSVKSGSSPHARGTLGMGCGGCAIVRIIPACAGNACWRCPRAGTWPDHPRMRGERHTARDVRGQCGGSSPHARGTRWWVPSGERHGRIIPACAGNARTDCIEKGRRADHPRMRGERPGRVVRFYAASGSSPHARGTLRSCSKSPSSGRIIPACAGNACLIGSAWL